MGRIYTAFGRVVIYVELNRLTRNEEGQYQRMDERVFRRGPDVCEGADEQTSICRRCAFRTPIMAWLPWNICPSV